MKRLIENRKQGFTLVELIVAMAVFITVLVIASQTFNTVIMHASKYSKMEESNIEGAIGLEILRHDLEQMGFGLFWGLLPGSTMTYLESDAAASVTNDSPSGVPRAFVGLNDEAIYSSDFIAIKATTVGRNRASQRWTYASFQNYSATTGWESRPINWPSGNITAGDSVIAIRHNFNNTSDDHLLLESSGTYKFNYSNTGTIHDDYLPTKDQQMSMIYGVETDGASLRMPFNRADYFISTTAGTIPNFCAPNTGVLYKATVNHADGNYTYIPLMDCVADMQVVLGWDISEEGRANSISAFSSLPDKSTGTVSATGGVADSIKQWLITPQSIREHLKLVKVYVLAQEGKRELGYTFPLASMTLGDEGAVLTKNYAFSAAQRNYRWKLYKLVVRPKNLITNQQ